MNYISLLFRNNKQYNLFIILMISTLFNFLLVFFRMYYTQYDIALLDSFSMMKSERSTYGTFFFLIWNLILAWMPYWIAMTLSFYTRISQTPSVIGMAVMLLTWLLFFPNAPYITTDLLHLKDRVIMPHWYDLLMIVSFAWTGLILGYCSLFEIHNFLKKRFSNLFTWSVVSSAIWLGGFGVYMGRFQRWNSWDALIHPFDVFRHQLHVLANPMMYLSTLGMAVVLSCFLLLGYLTLNAMRQVY